MRNWLHRFVHSSQVKLLVPPAYELNDIRDIRYAHRHKSLDNILHVFHLGWHGIRSATGALPGHKLGIHPDKALTGSAIDRIFEFIEEQGVSHIVFQAYSIESAKLAAILRNHFGSNLHISNISHVTASQLRYKFEIDMIEIVNNQIDDSILDKRGSVKPDVNSLLRSCHKNLIYNCSPNLQFENKQPDEKIAFIPIENIFRKNLFTNCIAALESEFIKEIWTVNSPSHLSKIVDVSNLKKIDFMNSEDLFSKMRKSSVVLNVTFAECQPMTQLEALACDTPCLTGALRLPVLENTALARITTVTAPDNVSAITKTIDAVMELTLADTQALNQMIADYRNCALELTIESYKNFLGLE